MSILSTISETAETGSIISSTCTDDLIIFSLLSADGISTPGESIKFTYLLSLTVWILYVINGWLPELTTGLFFNTLITLDLPTFGKPTTPTCICS